MALATLTTIPSFSGAANITDGQLAAVLSEHKTALESLDTAQAAALSAAATVGLTGIVKRTVTITQAADLAGVAALTLTKSLGAVLPTGARVIGYDIDVATLISGGAISAATVSVGVTGTAAAIGAATSVFTGQTGFPKAPTAGAKGYPMCSLSGLQATVVVTAVGANLSAATAGSLTVNLFYIVLP